MSSSAAEKLDAPAAALQALREALPDWTPLGTWGLRTRVRGEWLQLAAVTPVGDPDVDRYVVALEAPSGRTFHGTVEGALARVGRLVA